MMMSQRLRASMLKASCSVVSFLAYAGRLAACVGGGEEQRFDQIEVALGLHAVHQDRADHAAPADQTYQLASFHDIALSDVDERCTTFASARLVWPGGRDDTGLRSALNGRRSGNDSARALAAGHHRLNDGAATDMTV